MAVQRPIVQSGTGYETLATSDVLSIVTAFTGELKMIAAATTPTGWLTCDGSAVSRATYADLFAVIGTTFGVGDGSTTFNLPDMRDRFPVGASGTKAIASTGGAETVTLSSGNLPAHTHTVTIPVSTVTSVSDEPDANKILGGGLVYTSYLNEDENLRPFNTGSTGSGTAVDIIPKYAAVRYVICFKGLTP
jgi:microcystin-dependent protein